MVTDRQVRKLLGDLATGRMLFKAAARCGMDEKTARRYRDLGTLPSEVAMPHTWRTRKDPFAEVWTEVFGLLDATPELQPKTLFDYLLRKYPGKFQQGQARTFQRGIRKWRATCGPPKEVFFGQQHEPGRLAASDFTHMTDLGVTIQGQSFEHLVYHFVLTYSNWESVTICFSESFESFSEGLQNALWRVGGVPRRHRSDRMSLAINNATDEKEFTDRYRALMGHYGLEMEKIQARQAHENGDVESSHRWFKNAVDQALLLRGSRDFESRDVYASFLNELVNQRNAPRQQRLAEEQAALRNLPAARQESLKRERVRVHSGSVIHVGRNTYSVDSRLIGEWVDIRIGAEQLQIWYGQQKVDCLPRLRGQQKHRIDYRHVIDWLVRKPGAFSSYRYREDLFPTSRFRMAYDLLCETCPARASREYLEILHLAARESEVAVDDALRLLLDEGRSLTLQTVSELVVRPAEIAAVTEVTVEAVDLSEFDQLFNHKEVWNDDDLGCQHDANDLFAGTAAAGVPGAL
jgi:hypothetical protein